MLIRPATGDDRAFLVEMARQASFLPGRGHPFPDADHPGVLPLLPAAGDPTLIAVAEDGSELGAVWCHRHDPPLLVAEHGTALPELIIAVSGHARGRGVGGALIDALAERLTGHVT